MANDTQEGAVLSGVSYESMVKRVLCQEPGRGTRYLRRANTSTKESARGQLVFQYGMRFFPDTMTIITMPSVKWSFEKNLLVRREDDKFKDSSHAHRTNIIAVEGDECIWRAALKEIPRNSRGFYVCSDIDFGTAAVRTSAIKKFYRCQVEELVAAKRNPVDAAWLDFNGQMTTKRMAMIAYLWTRLIKSRMTVTFMAARHSAEIATDMKRFDDLGAWMTSWLPDSVLVRCFRYSDTVAMAQVTLDKTAFAEQVAGREEKGFERLPCMDCGEMAKHVADTIDEVRCAYCQRLRNDNARRIQ